jgi:REP element-mobilizing transposase RayT
MATKYRRSPRLKDFDYVGPLAAHVTTVTRGRKPIFKDERLADLCLERLKSSCSQFSVELKAYCLMPDHLHLLVTLPAGASLTEFVCFFKQTSGYALKPVTGEAAWQVSYHDRILRQEESLVDVARYIWHNPVDEGLVAKASEYRLSGPAEVRDVEL